MTPKNLIDLFSLEAPMANELRRILTAIRNRYRQRPPKSILVTSAAVGEGKSTIASFLALTAAARDSRVLLIDADLRRPMIHAYLGLPLEMGLTDWLTKSTTVAGIIKPTRYNSLNVITAGTLGAQAGELFDPKAIGQLISEQTTAYDLIIVDCAPVVPVADPMLLSAHVDGVLMIVKAGATPRDISRRAVDILQSGGGQLMGVIVNNMESSLPSTFNYQRYGEYYDLTGHDLSTTGTKTAKSGHEKSEKSKSSADPRRPEKTGKS